MIIESQEKAGFLRPSQKKNFLLRYLSVAGFLWDKELMTGDGLRGCENTPLSRQREREAKFWNRGMNYCRSEMN
ncbi:Uncharacterized protein dnm_034930 [Desulfonema magnum]|uniref:Uncharacterized protein n=1 Tax=Desulfonema magnum TaxID=45655 RepID=A0A975BM07_9BACT|nr:Uncharacterized protein dnm_034930 [Desulfonema magnum]